MSLNTRRSATRTRGRMLHPAIARAADPRLREHELYAYYYDRVDQPAVAHESE
jgi:hypothetical protein